MDKGLTCISKSPVICKAPGAAGELKKNSLSLKLKDTIKNDLQNLFSGKGEVRFGATIQAVANYLERSSSSSQKVEDTKLIKKQEAESLEVFITENDLWK
ncbi:MAG: hypothetical protein ACK5XQ_01915 [Flavobacteriales bacterium]